MKVKDLKAFLEGCDDDMEIRLAMKSGDECGTEKSTLWSQGNDTYVLLYEGRYVRPLPYIIR